MCVGYEIDGKITKDFPTTPQLEKAKPVLKTMPGWKSDIRGITNYEELPVECRNYIETIERRLKLLSQWYLMVQEDMRLSTERVIFLNNNN